ncbi:hypothetical protein PSTG_13527 [Puccinia striiformis f. sp. tritici PST-78]|uniref:F-box domain-containing protein n=1 Tax=Puccinia striiformis f. sp. tritici PST-78 TaxID=1165861 RepID=A0A0L0V1F5_9BASI|nr:hypothetical protein PSTG_13527 [Puccinia striiformis f. sp. tritici PST-78]
MADISNLPNEVLELIFQSILSENTRRYDIETQGKKPAESVGKLRSVCRRWSSLITDRHLYQTLEISCGTRAMEFINHQKASLAPPFSDVRPKCRVLKIYQFWTFGAPPDKDWDMVTPALIEGLIELFNNTIVELELEFIDTLSLPDSTIQTIGRIKNLRTLRLRNMRVKAFDSPDSEDEDDSDNDPHFFYSLLSAAQELKCLIIARFDTDHLPKISESDLARFQLPSITHLVAEEYSPANLVLSLALALKPTLTMLSIFQLIYDHADNYVALLELLQDKLQGLQIMSRRILDTISNLTFSSLRLLHIDAYKYGRPDYLKLAMFSHAPIEVLVLSSHYKPPRQHPDRPFLLNLFDKFRSLRRLVFYGMDPKYSLPEDCSKLCQDHQVECLYRDNSSLSELMEL